MPNLTQLEQAIPVAPLKIVALDSARDLGNKINDYLVDFRKAVKHRAKSDPAFHGYIEDTYLLDFKEPRFGSGEAKVEFRSSVH